MFSARTGRYIYLKQKPSAPVPIISALLMFIGAAILAWVSWPIISFKLLVAPRFRQVLAPIPEAKVEQVLAREQTSPAENTNVDYTKASNWFPQIKQEKSLHAGNSYKLSIPKIGIEDATAIVGSEDLSKSLIHFGGTAMPGEYGNAVIFGHSTLPYFYNPRDYTTIFSALPKLKKGDQIFVDYDGLRYQYIIEEMFVVKPKDIQILEQRFDDSYLTLVTCVPPGTYLERLVVRARLQKI